MNETALAYFAGFFDAEGSISIAPPEPVHRQYYQLRVYVTNSNEAILKEIQAKFGVGSLHKHKLKNVFNYGRITKIERRFRNSVAAKIKMRHSNKGPKMRVFA